MICDQFTDDLFALYAIGALEESEASPLRSHLETGCDLCGRRLIQALMQAVSLSETVPPVEPSAALRDRISASVGIRPIVQMPKRTSRATWLPWLAAAASFALFALTVIYEENSRRMQASDIHAALEATTHEQAERTAGMLSILQAPGTRQVAFNINQSQLPHGSLFIHKQLGVAMVLAHLPAAPAGWKYESWILPKSGVPRPVESFATDNTGFAFTVVKGPVDISQWSAMAVSMEPENSKPVKPTKVVFASPV